MPDVAVALFLYNRPALTRRVFERIRVAQPARLFVIADGPKPGEDESATATTRRVTEAVDWPCEVERDYADSNLGIGRRIASGIEAVLGAAGEAIFLEDDCLPDHTFFRYCAELLIRYRDTPEIMMISGFNPLAAGSAAGTSYGFTRFGGIWGWACWQRAFEGFSLQPPAADDAETFARLRLALGNVRAFDYYRQVLAQVRNGAVDTWDYQWTVHRLLRSGLCAVPRCNLVENIGFGSGATHSAPVNPLLLDLGAQPIAFPLRHPPAIAANAALDERLLRHRLGEPVADDLHAACERLLRSGRLVLLLALATSGRSRYRDDGRFARLRVEALERLGKRERAQREQREAGDPGVSGDA